MTGETPSAFSAVLPGLQLAWDATSLKALQFCPRSYQLGIIEGWGTTAKKADLWFGGIYASAVEAYRKSRLDGQDKATASLTAVRVAFCLSGHFEAEENEPPATWVPDGGLYMDQWRCTGVTKYRNAKGNAAKCPYSHKGVWQSVELPSTCGTCGSPTECVNRWVPDGPKDRYALIRLVIAYCDSQPESVEDGIFPYAFPDGTPAVELGWRIPTPWTASTGERYILAGYYDAIVSYGDELFVDDNKTTTKTLNDTYFDRYSPDTQVDLYDLSAYLQYPRDLNLRGVIIEAASFTPSSAGLQATFVPRPLYRTPELREEELRNLEYTLREAERYAQDKYWPMRKSNCWLCAFKGICSEEPQNRQTYLEGAFEKREWNPLKERA